MFDNVKMLAKIRQDLKLSFDLHNHELVFNSPVACKRHHQSVNTVRRCRRW